MIFLHFRRPFSTALGCDPRKNVNCKEKFGGTFFHHHNYRSSLWEGWENAPHEECANFIYKQGSTKILGPPNLDGLTTGMCSGGSPWASINYVAGQPLKSNPHRDRHKLNIYPKAFGACVFLFTLI